MDNRCIQSSDKIQATTKQQPKVDCTFLFSIHKYNQQTTAATTILLNNSTTLTTELK